MTGITVSAMQASRSPTLKAVARFGLVARGFIYVVIGWLAVQIARGHGGHQANQRGAVAEVAQQPFGTVLLCALGLGLAAYAIWRLSEAAFGTATDGSKLGPRLVSLVRGIVYAAFCIGTFSFLAGASNRTQSEQQVSLTARTMNHPDGRFLVGVIGAVVVVVGAVMVIQGITKRFEKDLKMTELSSGARRIVIPLGMVGTTARGVVFALAGGLVVEAAVKFEPGKSTGLDGALRTLVDQTYGAWLLAIFALGLIAFGLYGIAAARWAKT
jgi:hypothetical protein